MSSEIGDRPESAGGVEEPIGKPATEADARPDGAATETTPSPGTPWGPSPPRVHAYKDADALAEAAAKRFVATAERAVARDGQFLVVLAGGRTPRGLYRKLTESPWRERVAWDRTYFVFGDERCVPPDHEDSNYRMVRETLLDPLGIPALQVLRMKGEHKPDEAARWYEVRLDDLFLLRSRRKFDLVLLGIGADGHTASLFPGTAALDETERWVVAHHVPQVDAWRLTLTFKALNAAGRVVFLATGEDKARVVAEAFGGLEHPTPHPCERVAPLHVRREVLLDPAAAALLQNVATADTDDAA